MDEITVRVHEAWRDGSAIRIFDLRPDSGRLPPFTAGAHVNVNIGPDLVRQYSLLNDPGETHRYVIAVALDPASRGGSRHMVESVAAGTRLSISPPRSHFSRHADRRDHRVGGGNPLAGDVEGGAVVGRGTYHR